jgi:hypothetical protein
VLWTASPASSYQHTDVYHDLLHHHAVRLYAKFLEHVKHDPWAAAKWFA